MFYFQPMNEVRQPCLTLEVGLLCVPLFLQTAWQPESQQDQQKLRPSWFVATLTMPVWNEAYPPPPDQLQMHRYVLSVPSPHLSTKASAVLTPFSEVGKEPHRGGRGSSETSTRISETRVDWAKASETSTRISGTRVPQANASETSTRDSKTQIQLANASETSIKDCNTQVHQVESSQSSVRDSKTQVHQVEASTSQTTLPAQLFFFLHCAVLRDKVNGFKYTRCLYSCLQMSFPSVATSNTVGDVNQL